MSVVNGFLAGLEKMVNNPKALLMFIVLLMIVVNIISGKPDGTISFIFGWAKDISKELMEIMDKAGYQIVTLVAVVLALNAKK